MRLVSSKRREFVARMLADLGKAIFAVGLASYFFERFQPLWRVIFGMICFVFLCGSILIEPMSAEKNGGK